MSLEHSPARLGTRVLRRRQVLDRLGISHSTLYTWIRAGVFPKPISLGLNSKAWLEDEVDEFIARRRSERDDEVRQPVLARAKERPQVDGE